MSRPANAMSERLTALRTSFDRSFAEPPPEHHVDDEELLAVCAGRSPYAVRLSQTRGLHAHRTVVPLPGPVPALRGLAGFGGGVVPVYDLATLLGHPAEEDPRWLVVAAGSPPLALAFTGLEGHLRVPAGSVLAEPPGADRRGCLGGLVALPDGTRPVVDVPSVRAAVQALARHTNGESGHS